MPVTENRIPYLEKPYEVMAINQYTTMNLDFQNRKCRTFAKIVINDRQNYTILAIKLLRQ